MQQPTTRVYRKQVLEGFSIPAIIHNSSYFFVDIDVYENGRVSCWNFEDFESFKKDVNRGWVVLSVPNGQALSVHGLGSWNVAAGNWLFTPQSFISYVESLVRTLNPAMENLYQYREKTIKGVRIGEWGNGTVFKEKFTAPNNLFPEKVDGDSVHLFYRTPTEFKLVRVTAFADGTLEIGRLKQPRALSFEELEQLVAEGTLLTAIPPAAPVSIYGLGTFVAQESRFVTAIADKVAELHDIRRELSGRPTTVEACRLAHEQYAANPTGENRDKLRVAYEAVPDHQKMFVGDMDTKDVAVRMILYGEQELENWSHYQVAKSRGEPLPGITIPKPATE